MQGRLLPKFKDRYQAHPVGYWKDEFVLASNFGLDLIEFILDYNDLHENPLSSLSGIKEIKSIYLSSGVDVHSICADYFMVSPLHSFDDNIVEKSTKVFLSLNESASKLNIKDIVLPCVDHSSISSELKRDRFIEVLSGIVPLLNENINISLETDLGPQDFVKLLERLNSPIIKVNYDIGNSASLGFKFRDELDAYGQQISDIHIKDRMLNGGPVVLGSGNAKIPDFLRYLRKFDYSGPFIMQAYRDNQGIDVFIKQLIWFKKKLKENFYE